MLKNYFAIFGRLTQRGVKHPEKLLGNFLDIKKLRGFFKYA